MELVYVSRAIKRYWWVTALFVVLGTLAGALASPSVGAIYEAEARVQVLADEGSTSNDRDVQNQLVLLDSEAVAASVAERLDDVGTDEVRRSVIFTQVPSSDVIRVVVQASSPELARDIANGYVDAYVSALRNQVEGVQEPDLQTLDAQLEQLVGELNAVDVQIDDAMAPYLEGSPVAIPTIDQVAPALDTQRQVILEQYLELLRRKNELQLESLGSELPSQTTQNAALPTEPSNGGVSLRLIAGPFVGLILGVLASLALARLSPRVLDAEEAAEILGSPLAGEFSKEVLPVDASLVLVEPLPSGFVSTIHDLAVRAEAYATGSSLTIAVSGSDRAAGSTTIAAGLARHFANQGAQVLLIDIDTNDPTLSADLGEGVSGVRILLSSDPSSATRTRGAGGRPRLHATPLANLRFAGLGDATGGTAIRRQDIAPLLDAARQAAQVVIIDCGALMDSASSVQLAQTADSVVLPIPLRHQTSRGLGVVARQLVGANGLILPVTTPTRGTRRNRHQVPPNTERDAGSATDRRPTARAAEAAGKSA